MKIFLLLAFTPATFFAQSLFIAQNTRSQEVSLSYGIQPNMAFRAGYTRMIPTPFPLAVSATFETGGLQPVKENFSAQAGAQAQVYRRGRFVVANDLLLGYGQLESKIYDAKKWELHDMVSAGFYGRKAGIALLIGYTQNLGTHIKHSDFYRETIYENAKDGWYGGLGGYWQTGLRGNLLLRKRLNLSLQLTYASSNRGLNVGPLPVMAQLGAAWRW